MAKGVTLLGILAALMGKRIADEIEAWLPWFARKFFDLSVQLLPPSERQRYGEEWRSHIESFPGSSFASAHFIRAALEIRLLMLINALREKWAGLAAYVVLLGLVACYWLTVRLPRLLGAEKPISPESAAQNSNLLLGVLLIAIVFVLFKQQPEIFPTSSGSQT